MSAPSPKKPTPAAPVPEPKSQPTTPETSLPAASQAAEAPRALGASAVKSYDGTDLAGLPPWQRFFSPYFNCPPLPEGFVDISGRDRSTPCYGLADESGEVLVRILICEPRPNGGFPDPHYFRFMVGRDGSEFGRQFDDLHWEEAVDYARKTLPIAKGYAAARQGVSLAQDDTEPSSLTTGERARLTQLWSREHALSPEEQDERRKLEDWIRSGKRPTVADLLREGDRVHLDTDDEQWGRIASDGTIASVEPDEALALVDVDSVRAGVLVPLEDLSLRDLEVMERVVLDAGYHIADNGTGSGWYALLPGQTEFCHEEREDGYADMNYLGFFSSKADLLDEVSHLALEEWLQGRPERIADAKDARRESEVETAHAIRNERAY